MERIQTEFGVNLVFEEVLTDYEKIIYQYPYTAGLCLAGRGIDGSFDRILKYRGINNPVEADKIKQMVDHFSRHEQSVPSFAKEIADVFHVLNDSFPTGTLYLNDIRRDDVRSYYYFAPVKQSEALDVPIECPHWLTGDYKRLWEITKPRLVGVGLDRSELTAVIVMEGYNFSLRVYFVRDIINAQIRKLKEINQDKPKNKNSSRSRRRGPGNDTSNRPGP